MNALWAELAEKAGVKLSERRVAQLNHYLDLLFAANETMNLTRINDRAVAEIQHVADALTVLPFLPKESFKLADIGSGGGVPGIPLAIVRPDATVTLIEATKKKAAFLRSTVGELGLANVTVLDHRAEEVGRTHFRESFDVVVSRAVAKLDWLVEWSLPLVRIGGTMLAMKGPKSIDELPAATAAIKKMGGGPAQIHPVSLAGMEGHVLVSIPKIAASDLKFPRLPTHAKGRPPA